MSKPTIRHFGQINNGELQLFNLGLWGNQIRELEGKEIYVEVRERPKNVTTDQHAYYRGAILPECLQYETFGGWEKQEVHEFFVDMFLSYTKVKIMNGIAKEIKVVPSTADISRKEMAEFIEKVLGWLAMEGIYIMSPEQYNVSKFKTIEE